MTIITTYKNIQLIKETYSYIENDKYICTVGYIKKYPVIYNTNSYITNRIRNIKLLKYHLEIDNFKLYCLKIMDPRNYLNNFREISDTTSYNSIDIYNFLTSIDIYINTYFKERFNKGFI